MAKTKVSQFFKKMDETIVTAVIGCASILGAAVIFAVSSNDYRVQGTIAIVVIVGFALAVQSYLNFDPEAKDH